MTENVSYSDTRKQIIAELDDALKHISSDEVEQLLTVVLKADRLFFVGVGRVMLSLESIAKRWAHLGIETHIVGEITEPALRTGDVLVVGSGSGESIFPLAIAKKAHELGAYVIHIGANPNSAMSAYANSFVRIPVRTKNYLPDEIDSAQPMTTLFEQSILMLGDIVAKMIVERNHLDMKQLWKFHANLE